MPKPLTEAMAPARIATTATTDRNKAASENIGRVSLYLS